MRVRTLDRLDQLAGLAEAWSRFGNENPFLSCEWLVAWSRNYVDPRSESSRLFVLVAEDEDGGLAAVAPLYIEKAPIGGRVLRFLGSGVACSEYLTLLVVPGAESPALSAIGAYLAESAGEIWDTIILEGVDRQDPHVARLGQLLRDSGMLVHSRPGPNCWRLDLPDSWDEMDRMISRSHRKQVRRYFKKYFDTDRCRLHTVTTPDELGEVFSHLVDLHQKRWESVGVEGAFSDARFTSLHEEVSMRFLDTGRLRLHALYYDDRVVACEYNFVQDGVIYSYQSGVDPDARKISAGNMLTAGSIRDAIACGERVVDFLRGDEPYKAHWRAEPHPTIELRVVSRRASALVRHSVWFARTRVKNWVKGVVGS